MLADVVGTRSCVRSAVVAGAAGAVAAVLVLAGCGGGHHGTPAKTWAQDVCTAVRPWAQTVQTNVTSAQSALTAKTPPATAKRRLVALYAANVSATDRVITSVRTAGTPDVTNGAAEAKSFLTALEQARSAFDTARSKTAALPTTDAATFAAAVTRIGSELTTSYGRTGGGLDPADSPELQRAFDDTAACN